MASSVRYSTQIGKPMASYVPSPPTSKMGRARTRQRRNFVKSLKSIQRMNKAKQWEYKILSSDELPERGWFRTMRLEGWVLIAVHRSDHASKYYFRREIVEN